MGTDCVVCKLHRIKKVASIRADIHPVTVAVAAAVTVTVTRIIS
jgi:hypothetical protein